MIFLMFQYLHNYKSFQCEEIFNSKVLIIQMLIINIKHIPSTYWTIKRQFLKFFKDFLIRISKKADESVANGIPSDIQEAVFDKFKESILGRYFN